MSLFAPTLAGAVRAHGQTVAVLLRVVVVHPQVAAVRPTLSASSPFLSRSPIASFAFGALLLSRARLTLYLVPTLAFSVAVFYILLLRALTLVRSV